MNLLSKEEILKLCQPWTKEITTFVYLLIKEGEIVYVGSTTRGLSRLIGHYVDFDSYLTIPCPLEKIHTLEASYILKFLPKYNHNIPKNPKFKSIQALATEISSYSDIQKELLMVEDIIKISRLEVRQLGKMRYLEKRLFRKAYDFYTTHFKKFIRLRWMRQMRKLEKG